METPIERLVENGLETFQRYYSNYRALVVDNNDPDNTGRLELLVPVAGEKTVLPNWAWPKGMRGGKDYGAWEIPKIGDWVWVEFEFGLLSHPLWSHIGYAREERPEEFETTDHIGYKTPGGTLILINDNKGEEEILIKLNSQTDFIKINKEVIEIESPLIKLGENKEQHALMGDTTKDKLDRFMDSVITYMEQYINHTHNTPFGPTSAPITRISTQSTRNSLKQLRSTLEEILSLKVYIDKGK